MNTLTVNGQNKNMMRQFMRIALPVAFQNMLTFGVSLVDTIMVGALGETELSAVTIANQPFFLFALLIFGLTSGAGTLVSQYWGKSDQDTISKVVCIVVRLAVVVGLVVMLLVLFFPEQVMRIYTTEEAVIPYGVRYLRIVGYSYVLFAVANAYTSCARNVERVKIAVTVYSVSFVVNVFFNYIFIFGKFGAPALGVAGAAVGTLLARVSEVAIVLVYALKIETRIKLRWKYLLRTDKLLAKDFARISMPVVVNEIMWSLGTSAQVAIIGRMSIVALASISVVNSITQMMSVFMMGAASATLVIIGKSIGAKEYGEARRTAPKLMWMNVLIAAVSAAVLILLRPAFINLYSITDAMSMETKAIINTTLLVSAVIFIFHAVNMSCIVGIFRGGGDTIFALWVDVIGVWGISIPLGALGGLVLGLSIPMTFLLLRSDEIVKAVVCLVRLRGEKWMRNVTRNESGELEKIDAG